MLLLERIQYTEKNVRCVVAHMQVVYSCSEKPPTAADAIANSCPQGIKFANTVKIFTLANYWRCLQQLLACIPPTIDQFIGNIAASRNSYY
jgi:hypothetical protein